MKIKLYVTLLFAMLGLLSNQLLAKENLADSTNHSHVVNGDDIYFYVLFGFDDNHLTAADKDKLSTLKAYIDKDPKYRILIIGHTDSIGVSSYNDKLAQKRAQVVADYLMDHFAIPQDNIMIKNRSEFDPIADNSTKQGQYLNRRTDVYLQRL